MQKLPEPKKNIQYLPVDSSVTIQSASHIWWEQLIYLLDSMSGKYSFLTYLDIMNDFIDEEIRQEQAQGLRYTGGHVIFLNNTTHNSCDILVELFFLRPENDKYLVKRAERQLSKSQFIRRDIALLEKQQRLEFNVEKPEE